MNNIKVNMILGGILIALFALALIAVYVIGFPAWLLLGIVLALTMVGPNYILEAEWARFDDGLEDAAREATDLRDEIDQIRLQVSESTTIDEVTGAHNERHFAEMLIQHRAMSVRSTYHFTLGVLEVDQHSSVVESLGLAYGNEVLKLFCRIVTAALREVDVLGRLDTYQFGIILSSAGEQDAVNVFNRISQLISQIQVNEENDIRITMSSGITSYHGAVSHSDLIDNATTALQFALEQGGDSVAGFNYQAAQDRAGEVEAELETARPSDDGDLADAQVDEADVGEEAERETP